MREEAGHDGVLLMDRVLSTSLQLAPDLLDLLAVGCVVIAAKQVGGAGARAGRQGRAGKGRAGCYLRAARPGAGDEISCGCGVSVEQAAGDSLGRYHACSLGNRDAACMCAPCWPLCLAVPRPCRPPPALPAGGWPHASHHARPAARG